MLRIYCDTGAYREELSSYERAGTVELFQFQYENRNRKISRIATPSRPSWNQANYKWSELEGITWADMAQQSEKWPPLLSLIGKGNKTDAQHLDSAYMSGCRLFLTSDKGDIARHRDAIEELLGLKVFHVPDDWEDVRAFIEENG